MSSPARYQPIATPAVQRPNAVSQATAIEQSRAVAEVQAAVLVAQQNRRNKAIAVEEMREATAQASVAERAFFKFPRGGQTVSGPSIHLARELARCWGNIQFGVTELRRDDDKGESEMQAYAWDLETNARNATTFIVPHKRDTKKGVVQLADMRDIYENNANNGARRLREAIFAVLPGWFVDEAQDRCNETLTKGGGVPLPQRIANGIAAFEAIGISRRQLEAKIGRPSKDWNEHDITALGVSLKSIRNGEVTKDEEFPPATVSAEEITNAAKPQEGGKPEPDPQEEPQPELIEPISDEQLKTMRKLLANWKYTTVAERLEYLQSQFGDQLKSEKDLEAARAEEFIEWLQSEQARPADGGAE